MGPPVGTFAGSIVEPIDVPTEDILPPTEDILPPLLPASEDILPASDNIPVRFTVGIVISAKLSHLAGREAKARLRMSAGIFTRLSSFMSVPAVPRR